MTSAEDDAESPGEIPGGKVLKATKLGPHLKREPLQAGAAQSRQRRAMT